jgi:hypothetical protein
LINDQRFLAKMPNWGILMKTIMKHAGIRVGNWSFKNVKEE